MKPSSVGGSGASAGPMTAVKVTATVRMNPTTPSRVASSGRSAARAREGRALPRNGSGPLTGGLCNPPPPKTGVEAECDQLGDEVESDEAKRDDHDDGLHDRDVA